MVFWITWTIQVFVFGLMALIFPYRDGKAQGFWLTRLYVLGVGLKPFARWQIALAIAFLWLGPWGVAFLIHHQI